MATDPAATEFTVEGSSEFVPPGAEEGGAPAGTSPSRLALRRLGRNRAAIAFGILFLLLVGACIAAPVWADKVAKTRPETNHLTDTIVIDGKRENVVSTEGIPIGPTWHGQFFMGADDNGRDVMVRLLYGGRNSLLIGIGAALMTTLLSIVVGLVAGYFRGWTDGVITRVLDIIWAFPVILLGVALGVALALGGIKLGPLEISADSIFIPMLVIAFVYVPYMARPVRAQVLALREKEFVEAARAQGAGPLRIMFSELLPNLSSIILVFFTLMVANAILLEAALSFLGAGVRPPATSWGTLIDAGVDRITSAPHLTIVPGIMLVLTVLSLNVFGDGVRDALDPRAKVRLEH
jgi:peptide/nickel transport system permease protein